MPSVEFDERQRDRNEARREQFVVAPEVALNDLVEKLMAGESYPPRRGLFSIDLHKILCEQDATDLVSIITEALFGNHASVWSNLDGPVEEIVRRYLADSDFVARRADDMADEAEEDGR